MITSLEIPNSHEQTGVDNFIESYTIIIIYQEGTLDFLMEGFENDVIN